MSIAIELEKPPLVEDATGAIRVGNSRVLLELVIRAFQDGATAESIVQNYTTLSLSDVYYTLGYFLRHQETVELYLQQREILANEIQNRVSNSQSDLTEIRARLLAQKSSKKENSETSE